MSSSKSKKKSKSTKIPEPIKIKREDDHLICPMEHYVDDRVELIRQIFSSLKPKTITNLAPDFLKKSKLEDIQQQCLNEILGISKKRLLSVINATKCPTDTETSEEEDVNAITEHISLEEISSDSDIAESKAAKGAGKKKKKIKVEAEGENNKQFSVLELLELQARARAIRSQLALEPVTKIEVDTDSGEDGPPTQKPPSAQVPVKRKKPSKTTNGRSATSNSETAKKPTTSTLTVTMPNGEPATSKRIKLKRNFRKQTRDEDGADDAKPADNTPKTTETAEIVPKKEGRSPSPDVVPIPSVTETLCISDSDEENKVEKKKDDKVDAASNDVEDPKPSAKASQQLEILSVVNIEAPKSPESKSDNSKPSDSPSRMTAPTESEEEGEIVEEEVGSKETQSKNEEAGTKESSSKSNVNDKVPDQGIQREHKSEPCSTLKEEKKGADPTEENKKSENTVEKPQSVDISESEDDDNDDVISLEGGDLVNEMKEHMTDEVEEVKPKEDIICLDDSSEDEAAIKKKTESWNDRWLNSRRVSKVLAASRLGNKVRNKVKQSKKQKKLEEAAAMEKEQEKPQQVIFVSKHELGSVEQYKEILESLPRKSTD